uniref:F-box/kelch-repeat protein At3g23880-like n=1 Tax=Fragaria vesca subsp. vesca TaxID=101020 RepID=UPI0005C91805|nr:PREDICTED: F-box/kelch-repeat protein At3g23880-like [Fragaria vesca subsp. vesca]
MSKRRKLGMTENYLPEDIIVKILHRVPLKPLIRFSTVSKGWHSIIFADPQFKKSHTKFASAQQTLSRRLLYSTASQVESLDLEAPSFGDTSSVRKLSCPFNKHGNRIKLLGSCNGLVCVALESTRNLYIWNPTNGFFQKLPDPGFSQEDNIVVYSGLGHLSATDDYKVIVAAGRARSRDRRKLYLQRDEIKEVKIFSLRSKLWIELIPPRLTLERQGTLCNEALHWLHCKSIVVFDLAKEEFRLMPLPDCLVRRQFYIRLGVSSGGCLCVTHIFNSENSIELWVMRKYGVRESWTKLFNCNIAERPRGTYVSRPILVTESILFMFIWDWDNRLVLKIDHEQGIVGQYMFPKVDMIERIVPNVIQYMIGYEESSVWLSDYHACSEREEEGQ